MDCSSGSSKRNTCFIIGGVGAILLIILLPLSFSYIDYYEYGLSQRKSTGFVDTSQVFGAGRYLNGPDKRFLKYQADAHYERFDDLEVFSASLSNSSIGLEFRIDIDLTYFLRQDEVGLLHQELASTYRSVVISRTRDAIKNEAIFVSFNEYFQERKAVEERFRAAVQRRWDAPPSLHCQLDQFHLGRIQIPDSVATRQLESRVQNERNEREQFLQQAQLEREQTDVEVNSINLERTKVLRTAQAEANLLTAKARAEADQIRATATLNGTRQFFTATGISSQDHMTAFTYIRSLQNRKDSLNLDVSYLAPESVVRTRPA